MGKHLTVNEVLKGDVFLNFRVLKFVFDFTVAVCLNSSYHITQSR